MTAGGVKKELLKEVENLPGSVKNVEIKSQLLQEVSEGHEGKELKHVAPKSGQDLLQEVRKVQGGHEFLKESGGTVEKQSLLQEVRAERRQSHLKAAEVPNEDVIKQVLSDVTDESVKAVPAIAKQSLAHGAKNLKHTETVEKQSLLQQVRKEHGAKDNLKHTETKSTQSLLSEVRSMSSRNVHSENE